MVPIEDGLGSMLFCFSLARFHAVGGAAISRDFRRFLGLLVLAFLVGFVAYRCFQGRDEAGAVGIACMVSVAILGLGSYILARPGRSSRRSPIGYASLHTMQTVQCRFCGAYYEHGRREGGGYAAGNGPPHQCVLGAAVVKWDRHARDLSSSPPSRRLIARCNHRERRLPG